MSRDINFAYIMRDAGDDEEPPPPHKIFVAIAVVAGIVLLYLSQFTLSERYSNSGTTTQVEYEEELFT